MHNPKLLKHIAFYLLFLLFLVFGCGQREQSSTGTGSISFGVNWQGAPTRAALASGLSSTQLDCTAAGVATIVARVYTSTGTLLASGGPWNCTDHSGVISNVPAGGSWTVGIGGINSNGDVLYYGEENGIVVIPGQTTNAGTIPAAQFNAPLSVVFTAAGNGQDTISWPTVTGATSYNIYWSTTSGVTKANGTKISSVTNPLTNGGLTNGTTYYYIVTAVNAYGESVASKEVGVTINTITTLASTGSSPTGIALDATSVYWTEDWSGGAVKKVDKTNGGTVTTLASGRSNGPASIAIDSTSVYWTEYASGTVNKVAITGGSVTPLASGGAANNPCGIAIDSTSVYWTASGAINKVAITGGSVTPLASGLNNPTCIAVDSTSVYWTDGSGAVNKIGINGVPGVMALATGLSGPYGIAVDSTSVYWTESGAVKKVDKTNGGTVTTLATRRNTSDIAVDSTSVYWTEYDWIGFNSHGTINKVGINGGTVTTIAGGQTGPYGIAIDPTSVYWTENYGNTIKKVPK
jgi:hypothetical protein